jgi:hypothetical protein
MGIKDLLRTLEYSLNPSLITEYKGQKIAVDASGWLHKALFACSEDMIDNNGVDSQLYVDFVCWALLYPRLLRFASAATATATTTATGL